MPLDSTTKRHKESGIPPDLIAESTIESGILKLAFQYKNDILMALLHK